jgi:general secretion pathway protein G
MAIVAMLLTLAVPRYFGSLDTGRKQVQAQNITAVRDAIDKFYGDSGRYPETLAELVDKRYLRALPVDPVTEQVDWVIVAPADATQGGVYDIRSSVEGSDAPPRGVSVPVPPKAAVAPAPAGGAR